MPLLSCSVSQFHFLCHLTNAINPAVWPTFEHSQVDAKLCSRHLGVDAGFRFPAKTFLPYRAHFFAIPTLFVGVFLSPKVMPRRNAWPIFLRPALRAPSYNQIGQRSGLLRVRLSPINSHIGLPMHFANRASVKLSKSDVPDTRILPDPVPDPHKRLGC
jgi:hypothetical protein